MRKPNEQMKLGVFVRANGHHEGAWRLPEVPLGAELDFSFWRDIARTAEGAKFDLFFLADVDGIRGYERDLPALSHDPSRSVSQFEPLTLLSALATATEHIGLAATASTTFNEPYHIARKFASLDYLSNGRAAWNVVTSAVEATAANFNRDKHVPHDARYRQAEEFVDIVKGLWDSYEDDAFTRNKHSGLFFDPNKLHYLNHKGDHYSVKGPLNVARPLQGHPVIVQAGASEPGRALAAEIADVIFGSSGDLAGAKAFYKDLKGRAARNGRNPNHLLILPGIFTVIGETTAEAKEKNEQLLDLVHPEVGLSLLGELMGIDLSGYPVDGPLPENLPPSNQQKALRERLVESARSENLTIRELYIRQIGSHGLHTIVGSPTDIADELESWFVNEGADGFNIMASHYPGGFDDFARLVVPELRRRGLFRTEYDGKTLRDNLGLPRVPHRVPATRAHIA
ncbi:LLM class flavin-dependent oxidoreductase [Paraburkholderia caribensis]|uniref:LLM class flavin-dependent oxidoreductase n=1 Tax=Paraburkholderia caribensis TaxID=75105 RepID=UPI003CD0B069